MQNLTVVPFSGSIICYHEGQRQRLRWGQGQGGGERQSWREREREEPDSVALIALARPFG